jgi:polyferredoxin
MPIPVRHVRQDTYIVSYDSQRGETRSARGRKGRSQGAGAGDCIDCDLCVQVCLTSIDIRDGLQYECINCGACVDACDQTMERMGYPGAHQLHHRAQAGPQ